MKVRRVLLGAEAVALAGIHAGATGIFSYPGSPATEVFETASQLVRGRGKNQDPHDRLRQNVCWSANAKSAYEEALGHSYTGKRAMVAFAHVGLNVAMDALMSSALTGCNGGLVVVVGDDPGMHSSQSGQDSRYIGDFAQLLCLEPWDQQSAYDWAQGAFELSEYLKLPVIVRLVTRLSHSRAGVVVSNSLSEREVLAGGYYPLGDRSDWLLVPSTARLRYEKLLSKQGRLLKRLEEGSYFEFDEEGDKTFGIIACGLARNYVNEAFDRYAVKYPLLSVGAYPIPDVYLHRMFKLCDKVLIVEEGMPFVERKLHAAALTDRETLLGRMTGHLPLTGELMPDVVAKALGVETGLLAWQFDERSHKPMARRPATVCQGCTHVDIIGSISEVLGPDHDGSVFGDVGCYMFAESHPHEIINTCVDAGASIPMAVGASLAGVRPVIAVLGISAFAHGGVSGLIDAIKMGADIKVIITDYPLPDQSVRVEAGVESAVGFDLVKVIEGAGVDGKHIRLIGDELIGHVKLSRVLGEELEFAGVSVIICRRPCLNALGKVGHGVMGSFSTAHCLDMSKLVTGGVVEEESVNNNDTSSLRQQVGDLKRDIVVAGVGGQGVLPIAEAISYAAARVGLVVKQAETHGTSLEGESLISHVRYASDHVHSDLVQQGSADVLLAMEPLEALRWLGYLGPEGHLIVNVRPVLNIPGYPYMEEILQKIRAVPGHTLLDANRLAVEAGSVQVANLVLLGAAKGLLGFADIEMGDSRDLWESVIDTLWGNQNSKYVEIGHKAFNYGHWAAVFYRALIKAGVELHDALIVANNVKPEPDAAEYAKKWRRCLASLTDREVLIYLDESPVLLPANPDDALAGIRRGGAGN